MSPSLAGKKRMESKLRYSATQVTLNNNRKDTMKQTYLCLRGSRFTLVRVGLHCQARCDHHPRRQCSPSEQSQPPAGQWRWKQSPIPSAGLPQEVIVRLHMPPSSQIQCSKHKVKSGIGSPDWNVSMFNTHLQKLQWMFRPGHAGNGDDRR